jgi:DNA-binding MarR family transcriptional regulator
MVRESTDLGSCVAGLVNTLARETADLVASRGLIPLDFALLRLFVGRERWTTKKLAEVLLVKTSRISRVVTKLVDMGLMRRRRPRNDRRVVFLTLTEDGKALTLDLNQCVRDCEARLSEGVSEEEMATFASVTSTIIANHSALKRERVP